jgi:prepilin peptidase CpaA
MLFALAFVASVIYAILSDYSALRIPNSVPIALVGLFLLYWLLGGLTVPVWYHIALAVGMLVLLFAFFALGQFSAGDVKLASALTLWAGPHDSAFFILTFAILGGVLALMLMILRAVQKPYPAIAQAPVLAKVCRWARNGLCPYGIPLGIAAICTAPAIFAIR